MPQLSVSDAERAARVVKREPGERDDLPINPFFPYLLLLKRFVRTKRALLSSFLLSPTPTQFGRALSSLISSF
mgnify:CR=1 FL=1